jgi:hypothetical protein
MELLGIRFHLAAQRYAAEPLSEKGIIRQNSSSAQAAG